MFRIIIPLLLLLTLPSCSSEPQEQAGTVTIEFWTIALGDAFADYILGMISTYEQAHPGVKVKWVDVSGGEVAEKFLAALVGDTPPDLANIYYLPRFLQYDILVNMDEAVAAEEKAKRLENFWRGVGYFQGVNYVILQARCTRQGGMRVPDVLAVVLPRRHKHTKLSDAWS